jgi:hypothetical protein
MRCSPNRVILKRKILSIDSDVTIYSLDTVARKFTKHTNKKRALPRLSMKSVCEDPEEKSYAERILQHTPSAET